MKKRFLIIGAFCFFVIILPFISSFSILPSARYRLDFFTSENQFYLCDSAFTGQTGDEKFWTNQAYADRMAIADDIIAIKTGSYGHIKAELNVLDEADREKNFRQYDHVVEGSVLLSSGIMQVLNFPDSRIELKAIVTPGRYRVRVYSFNLKNINSEADEGTDYYRINLWRDNNAVPRKVLKQFEDE